MMTVIVIAGSVLLVGLILFVVGRGIHDPVRITYTPKLVAAPSYKPVVAGSILTFYKVESDGHHHQRQIYYYTPKQAQEALMDLMEAAS